MSFKDVDIEQVKRRVGDLVRELEAPWDGRDGKDGRDGRDGVDGEPGPQGEPGPRGDTGPAGRDGRDGQRGEAATPTPYRFDIVRDDNGLIVQIFAYPI